MGPQCSAAHRFAADKWFLAGHDRRIARPADAGSPKLR
ncbi:hypothetical protein I547_3701 [Mycobacterium kansasii 824]|uniref:Uncharacterized protein n=1 Tax=Mycobacterium kansasii TaxID=1768 RepID=A0A1V3XJN5_MYCKA|nr:hypothetical protein I547_3701 [Mycobacterium kansasii 824]OOK79290.1 hypothetical protein BZL30_2451 [Mycobacterium kansasii]